LTATETSNGQTSASSNSVLVTVNNPTTTALTTSVNPSAVGQSVSFTAHVTGGSSSLPGLIGHWTLDEASGSTVAVDSSGSGNDAHCGTSVNVGTPGQFRLADCPLFGSAGAPTLGTDARFDGTDDFLYVNN